MLMGIVFSQILSEHRSITSYLQKFHPDEDGPFGITAQYLYV
jgi:phosphatidylinositol 3-kinase